jgi:hypothetical protein
VKMEYYVLSDFVGDRLALLKAERERGGADPDGGTFSATSGSSSTELAGTVPIPHPSASECVFQPLCIDLN